MRIGGDTWRRLARRSIRTLIVTGTVLTPVFATALDEARSALRPGLIRPAFAVAVAPTQPADKKQLFSAAPNNVADTLGAQLTTAMTLNERSLAAAVVLPDAAKAGAMRPGETPRQRPQPPPTALFQVPALVDRPLEIDDGEKLEVKRFTLDGVIDRPQHKIAVSDVQALVDAKLAERTDGFTVGRLQEVADTVTKYYRDHGLILAQAFVPVQSVDSGEVKIQVMEGQLGSVVTEGNKVYKPAVLAQPFRKIIGQPITKEAVETALLTVSDYPGLSSFGVFQPGARVGTADMVLKVQDEQRFEAAARWDNHGIAETGLSRQLARVTVNNPLGLGDRFTTTVQRTVAPANTWFYALDYQIPVSMLYDTVFGIGMDRNQFDVGGQFRDANIHSDIRDYNVSLTKNFLRSRLMNFSATTRLAKKRSGTKADGRKQNIDSLVVASGEFSFDSVDARFGGLNTANLEISHGFNDFLGAMGKSPAFVPPTRQGGNGKFAQGDFNKVLLRLSRFQALTPVWDKLKDHNLLFTSEIMWSPDLLVPLEQYVVGGPDNVRGYRSTEKLFDRAVFGSVEWIINAPFVADVPAFGNRTWGEIIQFSMFYDVASGYLNSALAPTERKAENYNSVGLAFSFNNPKVFSSKLTIAAPVGSSPRPEESGWEPKYWLDVNVFF